jgi:hypothetical protein
MGGQKETPARWQAQPGQADCVLLSLYTDACNENAIRQVHWLLWWSGGQPTGWERRFLKVMQTILLAGWALSPLQRRHIDRLLASYGGRFLLKRGWQ